MCLLRHMWSSSSVVYYKSVIYPIHESQYSQSKLQNLTKTCGSTTNTKWLFFVKFISDLSKDIILLAQRQPFLMVTRLHSPAWLLFLCLNSIPNPTQFAFFLHTVRIPGVTFLFLWKGKRKENVKVILIGYFNDCLFTETSTVPAQAD